MADRDRTIGFGDFVHAAENYLGTSGFRTALIAAMHASDVRMDDLEDAIKAARDAATLKIDPGSVAQKLESASITP